MSSSAGGSEDVTVVVPARDAADTIAATIASVLAQVPPPTQIVVAVPPDDGATRHALGSIAAGHVELVVVDNPSGTTPDALNAAITAATGDVIARVDAHAVLPPGYLATACSQLRTDSTIGNVGGIQRPVGDSPASQAVAAAMQSPLGSGGADHRSGTEPGPVDTVYLGVFRARALDDVGGFDGRFLRNQDYELNVRLRAAGWQVWFDPTLVVDYRPRGDLRSLWRQYRDYGRWRRATMRLHPGSWRLRQLALPVALAVFVLATAVGPAAGAPWLAPALLAAWLAVLLVAGLVGGGGANPVRVAAALATMHLAWTLGFVMGPPRGWDRPGDSES